MNGLHIASLSLAVLGESECGDVLACVPAATGAATLPQSQWLVVIDGLGHGPLAAMAARQGLATIQAAADRGELAGDPAGLLQRLDTALAGTRGAAVGLAWVQGQRLRYAGVGNTRLLRWRAGQVLRLPSRYGIVGDGGLAAAAALHDGLPVQEINLLPGDWLLLFTDGLDETLNLKLMLPEWQREPQRLCEHLMHTWRNPRDDAGVLACHVTP